MDWNSSAYPIADIKEWRDTKKLEIRPDFQRNAVWSPIAQVMLIDTIIKNIPMPKIYFETKMVGGKKYRIVIDGQQRLTAILDYIDGKFTLSEEYGDKWAGIKFDDLDENEKNIILSYEIDCNNVNNPTQEEVNSLYSRVNKYTVQLNSQELRRADYPGDFIHLAEELASEDFFADARMFSAAMTRRMLDIEYIEELLCIVLAGIQNKKETIDLFCEKNQKMEDREDVEARFKQVIGDIALIFTEDGEMKIRKTRYKQRSDFYSFFAVINEMHMQGKNLDQSKVFKLQGILKELNDKIEPHSEDVEMSEYAIRCTSDANSLSSREWRRNYLKKYIIEAYV